MRQEIKNAFANNRFWIAILTMLLCFLGFSLPEWMVRCGQGDQMYMSAFGQSFAPIFFGGAMLMMPFCASIPHAASQVDEIRTNFLYEKGIRCNVNKYALYKMSAAVLSGAVAMGVASLLHSVIWNIVAGVYDPIAWPDTEVFFNETTIYYQLKDFPYAWPAYLHAAMGFAISGALWAMVGLSCAVWIPDTLLTITVPVILYYFWWYRLIGRVTGIRFPRPAALYNDGQTWADYWQALLFYAVLFVISYMIYWLGLKRRLRNV